MNLEKMIKRRINRLNWAVIALTTGLFFTMYECNKAQEPEISPPAVQYQQPDTLYALSSEYRLK